MMKTTQLLRNRWKLKSILSCCGCDADSNADVKFDTVDTVTVADGTETSDQTDVYLLTAAKVVSAASSEILGSVAYHISAGAVLKASTGGGLVVLLYQYLLI